MRKVKITFVTTPAELRNIARMIEDDKSVTVNWYHTTFTFENEKAVEHPLHDDSAKTLKEGPIHLKNLGGGTFVYDDDPPSA
jgi:hypothetical protein